RRGDAGGEIILYPTEGHVMRLAERWSLDPTKLHSGAVTAPGAGYVARGPAAGRTGRLRDNGRLRKSARGGRDGRCYCGLWDFGSGQRDLSRRAACNLGHLHGDHEIEKAFEGNSEGRQTARIVAPFLELPGEHLRRLGGAVGRDDARQKRGLRHG